MAMSMRDAYLELVAAEMDVDTSVYFLTADFGAPRLDAMREKFPGRVINVGVAEQNLVNVAVGLSREGGKVYCFAIAPFLSMRCFEQLRTCCSVYSLFDELNIQFIGVGAGLGYDMSGPTHHCLEDINVMTTLPRVLVHSPSDTSRFEERFSRFSERKGLIYHRFDSKPQSEVFSDYIERKNYRYKNSQDTDAEVAVVTTGFSSHKALEWIDQLGIDCRHFDVEVFDRTDPYMKSDLEGITKIVVLSEEFSHNSGLSNFVASFVVRNVDNVILGFDDYSMSHAGRDAMWESAGISPQGFARLAAS